MIIERALLEHLNISITVEYYGSGGYGDGVFGDPLQDNLVPFLTGIRISRGGARDGLGIKTDVGLMTLFLKDIYDPLAGGHLAPGMPVLGFVDGAEIYTGVVASIAAAYPLDRATGEYRAVTTVTVADAVADHVKTPRYGVRAPEGYETFEDRIARLAESARTPIEVPASGLPREVYAL